MPERFMSAKMIMERLLDLAIKIEKAIGVYSK